MITYITLRNRWVFKFFFIIFHAIEKRKKEAYYICRQFNYLYHIAKLKKEPH